MPRGSGRGRAVVVGAALVAFTSPSPVAAGALLPATRLALSPPPVSIAPPGATAAASGAIEAAKGATRAQAEALGAVLSSLPERPSHSTPSEAARFLLTRHGAAPTQAEARAIADLDALSPPVATALTRVIDAFIASEHATALAFENADPDRLRAAVDALTDAGEATTGLAIDPGPVFSARLAFLDAVAALDQSVIATGTDRGQRTESAAPQATTASCSEPAVAVPGVLAVATDAQPNCYTNDYRLVVDFGGKDHYKNNAGGNGDRTSPVPEWLVGSPISAAGALVDLGEHDDRYRSGRSVGINGGAILGSGFLYDDGGDDTYLAGHRGTNGGGAVGFGFLLDVWGDDSYAATGTATNGGGQQDGTGLLLDGGGDDAYTSTDSATNGGAHLAALGSLFDLGEGTDTYTASGTIGTNGGGSLGALGVLLDAGGTGDTYKVGGTTDVDRSEVPKGAAGAQSDSCGTGTEAMDELLHDVCAEVAGGISAIQVDDVTMEEGTSGVVEAIFTLALSKPSSLPVSIDYATDDESAAAPGDYTSVSGTLTFNPSQTSKTVTVMVKGDTATEPNETFSLNLSRAVGAVIGDGRGKGTILNDDPPEMRIADVSSIEGDSGTRPFKLSVSLTAPTTNAVSVGYATANGTAVAPDDYTPAAGSVDFAPGATSAVITVLVVGDTLAEPQEAFFVDLSGARNATIADPRGRATIFDDD